MLLLLPLETGASITEKLYCAGGTVYSCRSGQEQFRVSNKYNKPCMHHLRPESCSRRHTQAHAHVQVQHPPPPPSRRTGHLRRAVAPTQGRRPWNEVQGVLRIRRTETSLPWPVIRCGRYSDRASAGGRAVWVCHSVSWRIMSQYSAALHPTCLEK